MIRLLITGGPGSGCTTAAEALGAELVLPVFDSDTYFHKPGDPPFQEQYLPAERKELLGNALSDVPGWIVSGSVSTWGLDYFSPTHGVLLDIPRQIRMERLAARQQTQFGSRIESGGDMEEEHDLFMKWAAAYEKRTDEGRNLSTERDFLEASCGTFLRIGEADELGEILARIRAFVK